jgi:hypothetical protein
MAVQKQETVVLLYDTTVASPRQLRHYTGFLRIKNSGIGM